MKVCRPTCPLEDCADFDKCSEFIIVKLVSPTSALLEGINLALERRIKDRRHTGHGRDHTIRRNT
jgi:hypothetical protein